MTTSREEFEKWALKFNQRIDLFTLADLHDPNFYKDDLTDVLYDLWRKQNYKAKQPEQLTEYQKLLATMVQKEKLVYIPERIHIKTEIWWIIETDSPAQYISDLSLSLQLTLNAWQALKFPTKEVAEETLNTSCFGKARNWRILDHLFYV